MVEKTTETNSPSYRAKLFYLFLFSAAIGYVEAMVVVYLRAHYYPEGFAFPLKLIPERMIILELFREASTIIILISISAIAARKFWERFGYFIILFGLWDIFYYVWLKAAINWPSSLLDWDILFLIPLPWIGPVISPVLISVMMIVVGISLTSLFSNGFDFKPTGTTWILALAGTLMLLYSFMRDLDAGLRQQLPQSYWYPLLIMGLACYGAGYLISYMKVMRINK